MLRKCHWIVFYTVHFTTFCLGVPFFPVTVYFRNHKRINFKVATLKYKVHSTQQPAYLYNLIPPHQPSRSLRFSSHSLLQMPTVKTGFGRLASPMLLLKSAIIYLPPLKYLHHLTHSNVTSNTLFYLSVIFSPPSDSPAPLI